MIRCNMGDIFLACRVTIKAPQFESYYYIIPKFIKEEKQSITGHLVLNRTSSLKYRTNIVYHSVIN